MLNTSPDERFKIDQVLKSDWLREASAYQSRFNNNSVYGQWCAYPSTPSPPATNGTNAQSPPPLELTDTEANARRALEMLGITRAMLDEHGPLGSRSNVVATYRIVVNRLLQQRRLMVHQQPSQQQQPSAFAKPVKNKSRLCAIT